MIVTGRIKEGIVATDRTSKLSHDILTLQHTHLSLYYNMIAMRYQIMYHHQLWDHTNVRNIFYTLCFFQSTVREGQDKSSLNM